VTWYELHQLYQRQAAQKQQRQIMPIDANNHNIIAQTTTIADTIAATRQALLDNKQSRRPSDASLVLGSGVSLAFLELFAHENRPDHDGQ